MLNRPSGGEYRFQNPTLFGIYMSLSTDAMGWSDSHLHEFEIVDPSTGSLVRIGAPFEEFEETLPEEKQKIADYFSMENRTAHYMYDFGDSWMHHIRLEKILPRDPVDYLMCID